MTALKRRKVGKTKFEVTKLGLGGAPMGGFRATITDAEAIELTDAAYDLGVRYFDTSPYLRLRPQRAAHGRRAARQAPRRATCCRPRSAASCTP